MKGIPVKQIIKDLRSKLPDPRTRDGVKSICRFVVARATSATIVAIVHNNTDPDNTYETASVFIGAHVLGELVANATEPLVNDRIDSIADTIAEARKEAKEAAAEIEAQALLV